MPITIKPSGMDWCDFCQRDGIIAYEFGRHPMYICYDCSKELASAIEDMHLARAKRRIRTLQPPALNIFTLLDKTSWPWCKACGSYHAEENPTCVLKR